MLFKPKEYQERAIDYCLRLSRINLFLEPGLGKTACVLTAITTRKLLEPIGRVLVVMPGHLLRQGVWANEIEKWDHTKGLIFSPIHGNEKARIRAIGQPADLHFISYDNLRWLCNTYEASWPFDFVVCDESSKIKNATTHRFKAFKRVAHKLNYYINMSGSPTPNGVINLWAPCYMVDLGIRLGKTVSFFRDRWFTTGFGGFGYRPKTGAAQEILNAITDITITMAAADYLALDPINYVTIDVTLSPVSMVGYKELEKNAVLALSGVRITAANAAASIVKCRQYASGTIYDEQGNAIAVSDDKLIKLCDLIDEIDAPVIVGYSFVHERERILKAVPGAVLLESVTNVEREFNAGRIRVLLINSSSGAHGLNLQFGGNHVIWFTPTYDLEAYEQLNKRVHREGQTKPVFVYHLCSTGTIDEVVYQRLRSKDELQTLVKAWFKI